MSGSSSCGSTYTVAPEREAPTSTPTACLIDGATASTGRPSFWAVAASGGWLDQAVTYRSFCATSAGAAMLTACTDHEYRSSGIRAMSLSPGTVATQMQIDIKASGMNPVSQLDWSEHIPPEWPAKVLLWMCSKEADPFIGQEIRLKDPEILEAAGLA